MADATRLPTLAYFQLQSPTYPNPRIAAPINDLTTTTVKLTAPVKDQTGTVIAIGWILGVRDSITGFVENCYVPPGAVSGDGLTLTGIVRGVRPMGLDFTTGNASFAHTWGPDSAVFCDISGVTYQLAISALQGAIATGSTIFRIGNEADDDITLYAQNADGTKPFVRYNKATNAWIVSDDGVTSTPFGPAASITAGAGIDITAGVASVKLTDTSRFVLVSSGAGDSGKSAILNASGQWADGFVNAPSKALFTAKGVMVVASGANTPATQTVGTNGQILVADSTQSTGVKWGDKMVRSNGTTTHAIDAASGTQTIAHGLGIAPTKVTIDVVFAVGYGGGSGSFQHMTSAGQYDSSGQHCIYFGVDSSTPVSRTTNGANATAAYIVDTINGGTQVGTVSVDATNISISWVKTGTLVSGNMNILWGAEG